MHSPKRSFLAEWGIPVLVGFLVEVSSDLVKYVTQHVSTSFSAERSELGSLDFWAGILFTICLLAVSLWILEIWHRGHPKRWVRITVAILSVIIAGIVDPFGHAPNDKILAAYHEAQIGERMPVVLNRFQYHGEVLIEPNKDRESHNELDCTSRCWIRLTYVVPEVFGERYVSLDFDRDQNLIGKCDIQDTSYATSTPKGGCVGD